MEYNKECDTERTA